MIGGRHRPVQPPGTKPCLLASCSVQISQEGPRSLLAVDLTSPTPLTTFTSSRRLSVQLFSHLNRQKRRSRRQVFLLPYFSDRSNWKREVKSGDSQTPGPDLCKKTTQPTCREEATRPERDFTNTASFYLHAILLQPCALGFPHSSSFLQSSPFLQLHSPTPDKAISPCRHARQQLWTGQIRFSKNLEDCSDNKVDSGGEYLHSNH
jgi:hypothetical protein